MAQIYMINIGGAGTSALALLLHGRGNVVSGVDTGDGFYTRALEKKGICVHTAFDAAHVTDAIDLVVYSTSVAADNVELRAAQDAGVRTITYPEAIGELTQQMRTIAVCGTHGKTTTAGMTAYALTGAGMDPSAIVGAQIVEWGGGARVGASTILVLEADEYQNKLALYNPFGVILTSADYDHPDFFSSPESYHEVFADFIARVPQQGFVVANGDDPAVRDIVTSAQCRVVLYGAGEDNDCVITSRTPKSDWGQEVYIRHDGVEMVLVTRLDGAHNAANAVAAWLASSAMSGNVRDSAKGITAFTGTARRAEMRGVLHGAVLIDDYAHHPKEIAATIAAVREKYPHRQLTVAFHPHTFTRTQALLPDFAAALSTADRVIVLDIYGSAREEAGTVHAMDLVDAINIAARDRARHIPTVAALATWMRGAFTENDVCITMGAGDIWQVYEILGF